MVQIASVDWPNKRFFLHIDTVTNGFDPWEAFTEVRLLQQSNANDEQGFKLWIQRQGKIPKGGGRFTERYVTIDAGWRGIPVNSNHNLDVLVEMVHAEELSIADQFDRSGLTETVNIDPVFDQVEIIETSGTMAGAVSFVELCAIEAEVVPDSLPVVNIIDQIIRFDVTDPDLCANSVGQYDAEVIVSNIEVEIACPC